MSKFTVSILTYTQLDRAKSCIQSVLAGGGDVKIILTANGNPGAATYFKELEKIDNRFLVVVNDKNEGFWRPNNHAFAISDSEFFVMLNDDATVTPGWLDKLVAPFRDERVALTCPDGGCSALGSDFSGRPGAKEYCEGACLMVRTSIARKHGLFEEMPGLAYGEDSHLSLRYRELGYLLSWPKVQISHIRGATSRSMPEVKEWQRANHAFLQKRWAGYIRTRTFNTSYLLKRTGAYGDVLLLTPVVRAMKQLRPNISIYVETACPDIFVGNPNVRLASPRVARKSDMQFINLDGTYEAVPDRSFVQTYASHCGVTVEDDRTELTVSGADVMWAKQKLGEGRYVAVHPGPNTWPGKCWAQQRFEELVTRLKSDGFKVVLVGSDPRNRFTGAEVDLRSKTNVFQLGGVLKQCALFIGLDSFPMHAAQAVGTPTIGLFGVTLPGPIMTSGSKHIGVCSDPAHPFSGARHKTRGKTFTPVASNPMDTITVDQVMSAVRELVPAPVVQPAFE